MHSQSLSMKASISGPVATTHIKSNVRTLCTRVQTILRQRRHKQKRSLEISAPFNLTREPVCLPGISEDELCMLREKAAASRIGIAEIMPRSTSDMLSLSSRPQMIMRPSSAMST